MAMSVTKMRLLIKQVEQEYENLKEATSIKLDKEIEEWKTEIEESHGDPLTPELRAEWESLVEEAKELARRSGTFTSKLGSRGIRLMDTGTYPWRHNAIQVEICPRFESDEKQKKIEQVRFQRQLMGRELSRVIDRERLDKNRDIILDTIEDARQFIESIPSADSLAAEIRQAITSGDDSDGD